MKRITKIEIKNYRAFFDSYKIELGKAENLLIYGENGSGKSSLFKAINNYLVSSRNNTLTFNKNIHQPSTKDGSVILTFSDVLPLTHAIVQNTSQSLQFGSNTSNNNVQFIKDGDLIKGFLDYRNLLEVYNHKEPIPNLFDLIVKELLLDHYPPGGTEPLGRKYLRLDDELINVHNRNSIQHRNALLQLPILQQELEATLRIIFAKVNHLLPRYFANGLTVDFGLQPLTYNYEPNWNIQSDLRLILRLNGALINDHQDIINEARLSSLATCIYLASVSVNPRLNFDFKILFLDDIFIGLDTGNRLPIARILNDEFKEHQIFIATYDRQWYELAQRFFDSHAPEKWKSIELYTSTKTIGTNTFEIPVLLPYEKNFDKGVYYLHHKTKPDYPASANYFRKSAEEILKSNIPICEIRNDDYSLIETYKLGALVKSALYFYQKIGANNMLLLQLKNSLPSLLHPLSHYDLGGQVYKAELEEIQKLLVLLSQEMQNLKSTYRVFIPEGKMFKLKFIISATETGYYNIYTKEAIFALRDITGVVSVSPGLCHSKETYNINAGVTIPGRRFANNDPLAQYDSINSAYDTIYNFIHAKPNYAHIPKVVNYLSQFDYDDGGTNDTLDNHLGNVNWV